jgi:type VI secretion system protein ImpB
MSRKSYQQEIPKARINITLDVETDGAQLQNELPHKVLALGNFSGDKIKDPLAKRNPISVNPHNLDEVIAKLKPSLQLELSSDNADTQKVNLSFQSLKDFHPDQLVYQEPTLKKLIAMRQLLLDLRAQMIDNRQFKKELQLMLQTAISNQERINESC